MFRQVRFLFVLALIMLVLAGCQMVTPTPVVMEVTKEVPVTVEVPKEVQVVVTATPEAMKAYEPREIVAQAGGGQDISTIQAFLPETLHIRAGDTVNWKLSGDDLHTVSFLASDGSVPELIIPVDQADPTQGAMINPIAGFPSRMPGGPVESYDGQTFVGSGLLSHDPAGPDAPPNDSLSVIFPKPGTYTVYCLVHPWMIGTIIVHENTDPDVPDQAAIDAQVETELAGYLAQIEMARQQGSIPVSMPAADGSTIWFVRAGALNALTGDFHAQAYEFLPKELTIKAGDTIVWTSAEFHSVTFDDAPPAPDAVIPQPQPNGPPMLMLNPEVFVPMRPSPVYDPKQYFNSGDIGPIAANGIAWALTFTEPGTYNYICGFHYPMGMEGTIIVEPKS
jgi:plastocyanin